MGHATQLVTAVVENSGTKKNFIALSQDSWPLGQYHQIFTRYPQGLHSDRATIPGMGQGQEAPAGECFGKGKIKNSLPLFIGFEVRKKKGGLPQIAANGIGSSGGRRGRLRRHLFLSRYRRSEERRVGKECRSGWWPEQ